MAEPINDWLEELADALRSERRLRRTRIIAEARDHLCASADELERDGMSRREAEQNAVAKLGDPRNFAGAFSQPRATDWIVDTTAWLSSRVAALLLGLGALMVLIETVAWTVGAGPVSAQMVRVWRICPDSVGGECVGGWDETKAPAFIVLGAICLILGLAALALHLLLRRRYSDLELTPRLLNVVAELSLTALGVTLLIGGGTRSALDVSWHWVPLWLPAGLACLGAAVLLEQSERRRKEQEDWIQRRAVLTSR